MKKAPLVATVSVLLPAAALLVFGWGQRWVCDDAFIAFRVAENIANGFGPVFNVGERIEAATCPAWTLALALASWLGAPVEWVSVVLGLASAVGAVILVGRLPGREPALALGMWVYVALPPAWDFATSGLESGPTLLGLAVTGALLARDRDRAAVIVASFLPLIRPDLGLHWLLALGLVLLRSWRAHRQVGRAALAVLPGVVVPVVSQVLRMSYYAVLTPNTAIAKEAASASWDRGLTYLLDLAQPYWLWAPFLLLCVLASALRRPQDPSGPREPAVGARYWFLASGLLHGLYVVRLGGDFMHGRLLLPAAFALLAAFPPVPLAILLTSPEEKAPGRRGLIGAIVLVVLGWAVVCAAMLRLPNREPSPGVVDERASAVLESGSANPVTLLDYAATEVVQAGLIARAIATDRALPSGAAAPCRSGLVLFQYDDGGRLTQVCSPLNPASVPEGTRVVMNAQVLGRLAHVAGPAVHVVDLFGLSDPLAARLVTNAREQAGHKKLLPLAWFYARFGAPGPGDDLAVLDARAALQCGDLRDLLTAITGPWEFASATGNLTDALRFQRLQIPNDPARARATFCR